MTHCLSVLAEMDAMLRGNGRILIASDFDGTLCAIARTPSEACVSGAMVEVLRRVTACESLELAVITGRSIADIRRSLPLDIVFAGNHGLEIAGRGLCFEHAEARRLRPAIESACETLRVALHEWPSAWVEDKGLTATLHFRAIAPHQHRALLLAARRSLAQYGPELALRVGNHALEVRPGVSWDKGKALRHIQANAGPFGACICLGDERTDESMFRVNERGLNIRVGGTASSCAAHYLENPDEAAILLSHIVDACGSSRRAIPRTAELLPLDGPGLEVRVAASDARS